MLPRTVCLILSCCGQIGSIAVSSAVDFERDVAPILESRCISCHSADSAKGGVRLDNAADLGETIAVGDAVDCQRCTRCVVRTTSDQGPLWFIAEWTWC